MKTHTLSQTLARNLDLLRHTRQMGADDFVREAGISKQHLSLWRSGSGSATLATLERVAKGLGIRPAALLEENPADVLRAAQSDT